MDIVGISRLLVAIILLFFLPGFLLVQAIFPRKNELDENEDMLYRIVLGIALSIVVNIAIGFILGSMPLSDGHGAFTEMNILISIIVVSLIFGVVGWYRGAYPFTGRAADPIPKLPISKRNMERVQELLVDWKAYKKKVYRLEALIKESNDKKEISRYKAKRDILLNRIKEIDTKIEYLTRVDGRETEGEEILEQIQTMFKQLRKLKGKMADLDIKITISQKKGYHEQETKLWRQKEALQKKLEAIDSDINDLKQKLGDGV